MRPLPRSSISPDPHVRGSPKPTRYQTRRSTRLLPNPDGTDTSRGYEFVQRRRDQEVGFAIQRAVGATRRLRLALCRQAPAARKTCSPTTRDHPPRCRPSSRAPCSTASPTTRSRCSSSASMPPTRPGSSARANAAHHPDPDNPLTDRGLPAGMAAVPADHRLRRSLRLVQRLT
jgi:hypothetical protein